MSENEVAQGIEDWWLKVTDDRNRWSRGFIGPAIKRCVELTGNWKNAPRGNPRKGYEARIEKERI